ncbi:MAG: hypothetical protein BGO31_11740 [Bacteroidetes bacterium 43-16]|nr:MAG: hypothetical protein BGO31_11740 [Bacteroidetes bacterium 43-16]
MITKAEALLNVMNSLSVFFQGLWQTQCVLRVNGHLPPFRLFNQYTNLKMNLNIIRNLFISKLLVKYFCKGTCKKKMTKSVAPFYAGSSALIET